MSNNDDNAKAEPQEATNKPKELQSELASVNKYSTKSLILFIASTATLGCLSYFLIFSGNNKDESKNQNIKNLAAQNQNDTKTDSTPPVPQIPPLPEIPQLSLPSAPEKNTNQDNATAKQEANTTPVPAATVVLPDAKIMPPLQPNLSTGNNSANDRAEKKRKSSIMLVNNPIKANVLADKVEQNSDFKSISSPYLLSKGKIMEVILETAINTDNPGEIRAVVSRDVFGEDGITRLIPKGSKIFGQFKAAFDSVYGTISVEWNRIDLATGYVMNLSATSVDNLGRNGIAGRLDNKYKEAVTSSLISSVINISLAQIQDKLVSPGINTVNAAQNQLLSQNLNTLAANISTNTPKPITVNTVIVTTCATALGYFKDTTMSSYTTLNTQCQTFTSAPPDASGHYDTTFSSMIAAIQSASTSVATTNAENSTSNYTPTQTAIQDAVKSLGETVKNLMVNKTYKPNVTMNQGELIRVYINKDYIFPKEAINNGSIIK